MITLAELNDRLVELWNRQAFELDCQTLDDARAMINRLNDTCALLRQASYTNHSAHFDPTHGNGSGCPECIRARELVAEADALWED